MDFNVFGMYGGEGNPKLTLRVEFDYCSQSRRRILQTNKNPTYLSVP